MTVQLENKLGCIANIRPLQPFISVLVPVRNEERFIEATLRQLIHQSYDPCRYEILVADGRSTDRTREIVQKLQRECPNLRLLDNPRCLSSGGRNAALREARGEFLVLVDGHCEISNPNYLVEIADAFARSGADCLGRPQPLDVSGASSLQLAIASARASRLGHHPASHIYSEAEGFVPPQSVAVAYRLRVFKEVGQFDEAFDACEDVELNHRVAEAGMSCFFSPRIAVSYHPRSTLKGLFRQLFRYGQGRMRLLRKHPKTFSLPGFLPAAFLAGNLIAPLFAFLWPPIGLVQISVLGFYGAIVLLFSIALAFRHRHLDWLAILPVIFVTIHFAAGAGVLCEAVTGKRTFKQEHPLPRPVY